MICLYFPEQKTKCSHILCEMYEEAWGEEEEEDEQAMSFAPDKPETWPNPYRNTSADNRLKERIWDEAFGLALEAADFWYHNGYWPEDDGVPVASVAEIDVDTPVEIVNPQPRENPWNRLPDDWELVK